jgi:dTDP-4-amino-4,6-dideoxygalactose transaminase
VDGGALAFNDEKTYLKALRMRDFGINRITFRDMLNEISINSDITDFGYNAVMNELNAYIGQKVMIATPNLINIQRQNALLWDQYCEGKGYLTLNKRPEILPNYWIYSFLTPNQEKDLLDLRNSGFYASKVHLRNDYYSCFKGSGKGLIGVDTFSRKQLSVPSGWWVKNL